MSRYLFFGRYLRCLVMSSLVFGFSHAFEMLLLSLIANPVALFKIDPTGFITLSLYAILEAIIFFVVGGSIGYWLAYGITGLLERFKSSLLWYVIAGLMAGAIFLPICAGTPNFLFPDPDAPGFVSRCLEYILPMMFSCVVGTFFYWLLLLQGNDA